MQVEMRGVGEMRVLTRSQFGRVSVQWRDLLRACRAYVGGHEGERWGAVDADSARGADYVAGLIALHALSDIVAGTYTNLVLRLAVLPSAGFGLAP